jgi:hypothetical protein
VGLDVGRVTAVENSIGQGIGFMRLQRQSLMVALGINLLNGRCRKMRCDCLGVGEALGGTMDLCGRAPTVGANTRDFSPN